MKKLSLIAALLCLTAALIVPASALECVDTSSISLAPPQAVGLAHSAVSPFPTKSYDFAGTLIDAPSGPEFGKPTSIEPTVTADRGEMPNEDVSKNAALIPPAFGSPSAYTPNTGTPLTPNLAPGYMVGEGTVSGNTGVVVTLPVLSSGETAAPSVSNSFTATTADLYYSNGSLGTLSIPRLGVNVAIFEGTDSATLAKGAGHFTGTSIWAGNCCFAAHNRGVNAYFGQIHTLNAGDAITLTTKLGTRTYAVTSVEKVLETDLSGLSATVGNQIVLYTCVRDQPVYRWCVKGVEIM